MAKKASEKSDDSKQGSGNKRFGTGKILLIVFGVLVILIVGAFFYINSKLGVDAADATLYPAGTASVLRDGKTIAVSEEFALEEDDTIITADSAAKVFLYESVFITVEPASRITLKELEKENIVVMQEEGRTFSKITGMFDAKSYSVQTPTSIASAHGTGFEVYVYNGESTVIVSDGEVVFSSGDESITLSQLESARESGGAILKTELSAQEKLQLIGRLESSISDIKQRRYALTMDFITENRAVVDRAAEQYGVVVDEDSVSELFDNVDNGSVDLAEVKAQVESAVPFVNTELLEYLEESTQSIKKQAAIIAEIRSSMGGQ